jgi:p-aminobenzoyl-glutamate transporter AbgT
MLFIFLFNIVLILSCSYVAYKVIGLRLVNWIASVGKPDETEKSDIMKEEKSDE